MPTPVNQIANSITVITGEDLQREQRRTVTDALNAVPGLQVVQNGSSGAQTSVFIRGTNSNHVKVLIDGIDVSDFSNPNGAFDFAHLLTSDIEKIEVLRGPQSGLYGASAIGGVISITTKKGSGPAKVTGMVEGGSLRHVQPSGRRQRLAGQVQLRLQRFALPLREPAGDAGLYGAAGRSCHRQRL